MFLDQRALLFGILLLDRQPEAFDVGYNRTKEMAEAGGGVFYKVERLQDLAGVYERVAADLGTV